MSALAIVAWKNLTAKRDYKNCFSDRTFYVTTIADADIRSLNSLHTHFDHMLVKFEQNRIVRTMQNFELFDKKWFNSFDKALTPF